MGMGRPPFEAAGTTHPGRRRTGNEDAFAVLPELGLFMVADGVARNAAGDVASAMAVELVGRFLRGDATWPPGVPGDGSDPLALFVAAVKRANERIFHTGQRREDRRGMATTFAGVLLDEGRVRIVHAGDSRVYRLRGRMLEPLTEDHSFANAMVAQGMPEAEALALPRAPMLTRALGAGEKLEVSARLDAVVNQQPAKNCGRLAPVCGVRSPGCPSPSVARMGDVRRQISLGELTQATCDHVSGTTRAVIVRTASCRSR
jgi:serine/threonine protein phosphatase PrpC